MLPIVQCTFKNCKSKNWNFCCCFSGLRKVMVRAHRQAWCWQDEWYGLTIEDIRQLELETQLALAMKMAQFSQAEEATEANGSAPSPDKNEEVKEAIGSIETEEVVVSSGGETLQPRGVLTKQWSTSSRSSRSSKRGGESAPSCHLCMCDMLKILKGDFFVLFPCDMKVLMHLPPVFFLYYLPCFIFS